MSISKLGSLQANDSESANGTVTTHASAGTKGAWAQFFAATAKKTYHVSIIVYATSVSSTEVFDLDIGYGPAASETAVIKDLRVSWPSTKVPIVYTLPFEIPAASRIAARAVINVGTGQTLTLGITLLER